MGMAQFEVVDENLFRVAGTGLFEDLINKDMSSEGYVYENILRSGNMEVIYDPGRESLCQKCPKKNSRQRAFNWTGDILPQAGGVLGAKNKRIF